MNINITNSSGQPIYEQIATQIRNMILSGKLKDGDALPSMRLLAKELRISVITTKRAYEELEKDGFLYSVVGKGSFVAARNTDFLKELKLKEMEEHLREAILQARIFGVTKEEIIDIITMLYEEEDES
ncbi:MAG: GntR family transcriptional regulator [Lachnospiraceae bacterium]|nr:GntR family transcriptional regulator [Lachnospiraceae bacterium]